MENSERKSNSHLLEQKNNKIPVGETYYHIEEGTLTERSEATSYRALYKT